MTPHQGSPFLLCSSQCLSVSYQWRPLWADTAPFKGPQLAPCVLLSELQRNNDTIRCAALGAEVLGHSQEQLTQALIVGCRKRTCFSCYKYREGPGPSLNDPLILPPSLIDCDFVVGQFVAGSDERTWTSENPILVRRGLKMLKQKRSYWSASTSSNLKWKYH